MKMLHIARQVVARYLTAAKPPSKSQLDYLDHLLKQQKVPRPDDYDKLTMSDVSVLIDGLKKKRGKPVWYGNGQFSHWEKDAKLSPQQRGWERRKEQDERALNNIPPEHMHAWHTLKKLFKGTPDERAEQFMEYLEEHPGESDVWLQENADKEVAKATREWERKQRERAKLEKDCDKKQTLYENAWYKEQERATQEKNKLKQLKEKADGVCDVIENEYERVPFAASLVERVAAQYWTAMRHQTKLKDLPTSRLSGRPEVVLAPDLKPGMRLAYHKWMARTRLTQFPNRWFDMVVEAVDVQGKSVVVTWSGKFISHENADFYDPREPISAGKDRNRLRLDSKVSVLL